MRETTSEIWIGPDQSQQWGGTKGGINPSHLMLLRENDRPAWLLLSGDLHTPRPTLGRGGRTWIPTYKHPLQDAMLLFAVHGARLPDVRAVLGKQLNGYDKRHLDLDSRFPGGLPREIYAACQAGLRGWKVVVSVGSQSLINRELDALELYTGLVIEVRVATGAKSNVGLPPRTDLPFFAYGIFQRGEIAYPRIENWVKSERSRIADGFAIRLRDGTPGLVQQEGKQVQGDVIDFDDPTCAYQTIRASEPKWRYRWEEINVAGEVCNALIAKKPDRGSDDELLERWSSIEDPTFRYGLQSVAYVVREVQGSLQDWKDSSRDEWLAFFRLQGAHLLLWGILERIVALRFGHTSPKVRGGIKQLATLDDFRAALQRANPPRRFDVYSQHENKKKHFEWDGISMPKDHAEAFLDVCYAMRSNIAHRGKSTALDSKRVVGATAVLVNASFYFLAKIFPDLEKSWSKDPRCSSSEPVLPLEVTLE